MAADHIRVDYEQLTEIAQRFANEHDRAGQLISRLTQNVDELRSGSWIGHGADAFYEEMDVLIMPALDKLLFALEHSTETINRVAQIYMEAEDDAAGLFGEGVDDGMSSGGSAAPGGTEAPRIVPDDQLVDGGAYYLNEEGQWVEYTGSDPDYVLVPGVGTNPDGLRTNVKLLQEYHEGEQIVAIFNESEGFSTDVTQAFQDRYEGETDGRSRSENAATQGLVDMMRRDLADGTLDMNLHAHSQGGAITANALNRLVQEENLSPEQLQQLNVTTYGSFGTDYPIGANYTHIIHTRDPVPFIANGTDLVLDSPAQAIEYHRNLVVVDRLPQFDAGGTGLIVHDFETYLESADGHTRFHDVIDYGRGAINFIGEGASTLWDSIF